MSEVPPSERMHDRSRRELAPMNAANLDELRRFTEPSDAEIEAMWQEVLLRHGQAARVDFLPIETLICFGLGLNTAPSPSGMVNVRKSAVETQRAAALFGRPASSLQSKHSNLEARPGRDGGRWSDAEVGRIFASDLERFESAYRRTIGIARALGIDETQLPDFLGAESGALRAVIEAGELRTGQVLELLESTGDVTHRTVAQRLVTVRLSQQRFARKVLERSNYICVFCGLSTRRSGLPSARILVAGHIKPWRYSTDVERASAANGFAACPTHDAVFEAHLMTVRASGRLEFSTPLRGAIDRDPAWAAAFANVGDFLQLHGAELSASERMLNWHRAAAPSEVERRLRSIVPFN